MEKSSSELKKTESLVRRAGKGCGADEQSVQANPIYRCEGRSKKAK
jgi:hypothetical protein